MTIRASKKRLTNAEYCRRCRARQKRSAKAEREAERRTRRIEVDEQLGIRRLAIAHITDADLASSSVDAVITDPPYAESDVPLYGELARFAMRVLKPGGWCLAMAGAVYPGRILALMERSGLVERPLIAISFPGGHHARVAAKTFVAAKFILVHQKPPLYPPPLWGPNLLVAAKNGHDKSLHPWQQNQEIFEKLVERFTCPGDLVADPFAGSGTTLRAALTLGRSAWGSDIEAGVASYEARALCPASAASS
jgi:site-specific DNA-methyltransferase (adenine-specific)